MYSIENYDRPSVAADSVVFGIDTVSGENRKSLKQKKLKILLIRRGEEPFKGRLSLPGGFLRKGETIEQAALRELEEESGVHSPKMIHLGVYSKTDRDPRGWIISCAYLALTRTVELSTDTDSDAEEAMWFDLEYRSADDSETIVISKDDESFYIECRDGKVRGDTLAFDHAQIVFDAFKKLRDEVVHHDIIFDLMPEYFAISDLQQPYEAIVGTRLTPQGFRKKMMSKIEETEFYDEAAAHRTSKLYKKQNHI